MSHRLDTARTVAEETGFPPQTLEKVLRLGELVHDISLHPLLSNVLALKGGTPLNLAFGPPTRLSVDLDFNYIGHVNREQMLIDRPAVEQAIERLAMSHGYRLQRSSDAHAGHKFYMHYTNLANRLDRVEIDVNYVYRQPLGPVEFRELWQPADVAFPRVKVVSLEELSGGKICALLGRGAPRDVYDAIRLPALVGKRWEHPRMRAIVIAMSVILPHALYSYEHRPFPRITERAVRSELWPMLRTNDRPGAAALRTEAERAIAPLFHLTDEERVYVDRAQLGHLEPEHLLTDEPELLDAIRQNPALRWKTDNVRRYHNRH